MQPISDVYYGAPGFYYQVGYRKKDSNGDFTLDKVTKNLTYAREFEIPSPGVNQEWEFFVQSGNNLGLKERPAFTNAFSGDKSMFSFCCFVCSIAGTIDYVLLSETACNYYNLYKFCYCLQSQMSHHQMFV